MIKRLVAICDRGLSEDHPDAVELLRSTLRIIAPENHEIFEFPTDDDIAGPDDLVVLCGKKVAEAYTGEKKLSITKRAGHTVTVNGETGTVECILQLSPAYVQQQEQLKGGNAEKMVRLWLDVWEKIAEVASGQQQSEPEVTLYETEEEVVGLLNWILSADLERLAYDYETWGDVDALRPELCSEFKIVSVGLAWREDDGTIGTGSFLFDRPVHASKRIEKLWCQVLEKLSLVAHFARYEHKCNMKRFGFSPLARDTLLQLHALDELADGSLERVMVRCGLFWSSFKEKYDATRKDPMRAEIKTLLTYNALDAYATLEIHDILEAELEKENLVDVARQDEAFSLDLAKQEMVGMYIDTEAVSTELKNTSRESVRMLKEFRAMPEVKRTEKWAQANIKSMQRKKLEDVVFNPKSAPMMQHLLLKELKIPEKDLTVKVKGKTKITAGKDVLAKISDDYPVVSTLNAYRSAAAMTGMLSKWDSYIGPDGCVHSQYSQTIVVTGRLSSTNPPLQNIPKDNTVRRIFTSRFGDEGILIASDFRQQEPRLIAGWSQEAKMIAAILGGLDLHAFVGAEIFNEDYEEILARHKAGEKVKAREIGKRMNLGIVYGQTEFGLSAKTGMSVDEARIMLRQYDERFPGVGKWMLDFHRQAMELGYVEDLFGARRHLPGAQSANKWERQRALRQAGNYPVQGTAYRFTQISAGTTIALYEEELPGEAFVVGQVHDSLIVDTKKSCLPMALALLQDGMLVHNKMPYWEPMGMPMAIDVTVGPNLYDMKPVKLKEAA